MQALTLGSAPTGEHFLFQDSFRSPRRHFRFTWTLAPGKTGPGEHWHDEETETFHVQEGVLTIWIDGKRGDYGPGDRVSIPPRVRHRFRNFGKAPSVAVVTLDGPRMEDLFIPLATLVRRRGQGTELPVALLGRMLVQLDKLRSSTPASAPVRAVMGGLAVVARLFGAKPLEPVLDWASAGPGPEAA